MTCQFTLTGLLIGVLVGLTGIGGGALLTPILVILFGFKPTYAVGTKIVGRTGAQLRLGTRASVTIAGCAAMPRRSSSSRS